MTLLFSDLVGSTMLSERVEPEQLRDLFTFYRAAAREAVSRYSGYRHPVLRATASSPASGTRAPRGRRPARRARWARPRWSRCGTPAPSWSGASASRPEVRVGIHTGRVVVTDLSDDRARGRAGLDRRAGHQPRRAHPAGGRAGHGRDQRRHPAARGRRLLPAVPGRAPAQGDQPARSRSSPSSGPGTRRRVSTRSATARPGWSDGTSRGTG